jgi:predicted nucleic acid-binding protein
MEKVLLDTNIIIDWLRLHRHSRPKTLQQKYFSSAIKSFHKIPLYTRNPDDFSYVQHEDLIVKVPYVFEK